MRMSAEMPNFSRNRTIIATVRGLWQSHALARLCFGGSVQNAARDVTSTWGHFRSLKPPLHTRGSRQH